jgi:hypothetical protein
MALLPKTRFYRFFTVYRFFTGKICPIYRFTSKRSWLTSQIFIALLYLCAPLSCLTVSTLSDSFHSTMSSKVHTCLTVSTLPDSDSFNRLNSDRVIGSVLSPPISWLTLVTYYVMSSALQRKYYINEPPPFVKKFLLHKKCGFYVCCKQDHSVIEGTTYTYISIHTIFFRI